MHQSSEIGLRPCTRGAVTPAGPALAAREFIPFADELRP